MRLTLLLPGLLWPRQALRDTVFDLAAPALSLMLGRGEAQRLPPVTALEWLTAGCGLAPAPYAALRLLGEGGAPGEAHWLCLDPLHLRLEEWSLIADDPDRLELAAEEDQALREAVAPLFADWGRLTALRCGRWYLQCAEPPALATKPLPQVIGRPADPLLPGGADGQRFRQRLTEAQTLLHAHPVNLARSAGHRPTVSSLWPWGGGQLGAALRAPWASLWGNDPLIAGLAAAAGIAHRPLPAAFAPAPGEHVVLADALAAPAQAMDALAWRQELTAMEERWLAPSLAALRAGALRELRLLGFGDEGTLDLTLTPWKVRRFWRAARPLTELAP